MNPGTTQNIVTLLITAIITGFAVPALLKVFEAIYNRGINQANEIRNRQLEIVDQLTKTVWEWRFLGKQVCYYGCQYKRSAVDLERFQKAVADYDNRVWQLFIEIKAIKSKAIVWYSESVPEAIENLYEYIKRDIDAPMTELVSRAQNPDDNVSAEFYKLQRRFTDEVSNRIEERIAFVAGKIKRLKP